MNLIKLAAFITLSLNLAACGRDGALYREDQPLNQQGKQEETKGYMEQEHDTTEKPKTNAAIRETSPKEEEF